MGASASQATAEPAAAPGCYASNNSYSQTTHPALNATAAEAAVAAEAATLTDSAVTGASLQPQRTVHILIQGEGLSSGVELSDCTESSLVPQARAAAAAAAAVVAAPPRVQISRQDLEDFRVWQPKQRNESPAAEEPEQVRAEPTESW